MALITDYVRRKEKISTVAGQKPTVPPSDDHTDGSWSVTDIYTGELFINLPDGKLWSRDTTRIVELNAGDRYVGGLEVTNGSSSVKFSVASGDYASNSEFLVHPTTADEITIVDGDATHPRKDLLVVDETNTALAVEGTPSATPVLPSPSVGQVVIGAVFVPVSHTASDPDIPPVERDEATTPPVDTLSISVWATETFYEQGQSVYESNELYRCLITHNSDVFATDLAGGIWQIIIGGGGLYSGSGTVPSVTVATLTNTLLFTGGRIGIGGSSDSSAILDLASTDKGLLPPRMTNAQMLSITPATGLMVYDTDNNHWMGYNGTSWVTIA